MLFNSMAFVVFLPATLLIYLALPRKLQNVFLIAASYLFYGYWDPRFLILIALSTLVDFGVGVALSRTADEKKRLRLLVVSVVVNLGILGFFKYYNFFAQSLADLAHSVGLPLSTSTLNVILPVGISFYTFQTLSYTIDVYRGEVEPTSDLVSFAAFVAFFPQLVAGPIERARDLLPQFQTQRSLALPELQDAGRLMLWGFFKKLVIADNLDRVVAAGYAPGAPGDLALLATYAFAFQIYCDFSGYTDIARGVAKLFGFRLQKNFDRPYVSTSLPEFWKRWHISLSTWFREYLYIPLGGNRCSKPRQLFNVMVTFVVSGFWHGAHLRFIVWGGIHGLGYVPSVLSRGKERRQVSWWWRIPGWVLTFHFVLIAWVFFRASSVGAAFEILGNIGQWLLHGHGWPDKDLLYRVGFLCGFVMLAELLQRNRLHPLDTSRLWAPARLLVSVAIFVLLAMFANFDNVPFIYFQF